MSSGWLIDTSALSRIRGVPDDGVWSDRILRGVVSVCTATRLEIGVSARSSDSWRRIASTYPVCDLVPVLSTPAIEARAVEVQRLLADRGHHRAASVVDVLTAATAEMGRLTVLHVDKDFELIAEVTGQPVERLATVAGGGGARDGAEASPGPGGAGGG